VSGLRLLEHKLLHCESNAAIYVLVIVDHSLIFRVTIPDAASVQFSLLMMSI